jgi:Rrf2 family protein
VNVSAKADYAVRALLHIAAHDPDRVSMTEIIATQTLPRSYVEAILPELRRADFVRLRRGGVASYSLARPASQISIGSVLRAVDGPLTKVRGLPPYEVSYAGAAHKLSMLWLAASASLDRLLDSVTLADLISGDLSGVAQLSTSTHEL